MIANGSFTQRGLGLTEVRRADLVWQMFGVGEVGNNATDATVKAANVQVVERIEIGEGLVTA